MIIEIRGEDANPELRGRRFRVLVEELSEDNWIQPLPDETRPHHEIRILQEAMDQFIEGDA